MERRIGQGSWRDYRWSVLVEPDGDEQFLTADLTAGDGRRHTSGMGGPTTWPDRPVNVCTGRADAFPLSVLARADRAEQPALHLIPESDPLSAVEVVGRTASGDLRESARLA